MKVTSDISELKDNIESELKDLFRRCLDNNPVTFYGFLFKSMSHKIGYIDELFDTLEDFVSVTEDDGMNRLSLRHRIIALCQIMESDTLYDFLIVLQAISKREVEAVNPDGSVAGFPVATSSTKAKRRIEQCIEDLQSELPNLAQAIADYYNNKLRNGVFHSKYRIDSGKVIYEHNEEEFEIGLGEILKKYDRAVLVFTEFHRLLKNEQEKFVKSGGVEENGVKIKPKVSGTLFLQ